MENKPGRAKNYDFLVSVIIPVYNKEHELERCVNSVLKQTYSNLEVFLIDDRSLDDSYKICKEFSDSDLRVHAIKLSKNTGPSHARNVGLSMCKGQYVCFVDADDYIDSSFLAKMINAKSDYVACGFSYLDKEKKIDFSPSAKRFVSRDQLIEAFSNKDSIWCQNSCAKLYNGDIIRDHKLRFKEQLTYGEDLDFNLEYSQYVDGGCLISDCLYKNTIIANTLSRRRVKNLWEQMELIIDTGAKVCNPQTGVFSRFFTKRVKVTLYNEFPFLSISQFSNLCRKIRNNRYYSTDFLKDLKTFSYNWLVMILLNAKMHRLLYFIMWLRYFFEKKL